MRIVSSFVVLLALIRLGGTDGRAATVNGSVDEASVVWVTDERAVRPLVTVMRNASKAFVPDVVAIPVGSTIRFPNDDPFFHSIYSSSDADPFDIGFYSMGPGKEVVFDRAGVLDVRCHIHALMHATIVVVDGPYARADSTFTLSGIESGDRVIHAWSVEKGLRTLPFHVPNAHASVAIPRL